MQSDQPDGSFSADELARLEASGFVDSTRPGTPEAAAFDQELIDELEAADAELLALEGPDAFTSARLFRQTALTAELDPERIGHAFATWCTARGWKRSDLADYLGVSIGQLAAMAIERRADPGYPLDTDLPQLDLAERFGANPARLAEVLTGVSVAASLDPMQELTAVQIARSIGVTRETVLNWARRGLLPGTTRVSSRNTWLFLTSDLEIARRLASEIPAWHRNPTPHDPSEFRTALESARRRAGLTWAAVAAASNVS